MSLKILSLKQMLQKLLIVLVQVKVGKRTFFCIKQKKLLGKYITM